MGASRDLQELCNERSLSRSTSTGNVFGSSPSGMAQSWDHPCAIPVLGDGYNRENPALSHPASSIPLQS